MAAMLNNEENSLVRLRERERVKKAQSESLRRNKI